MFKKLSFWLIKKYRHSTIPQWIVLIIDIVLFFVAFVMMEAFRGGGFQGLSLRGTFIKLVLSGMLTLIFFFVTGSYKGIIRHAGMSDIYKILIATIGPVAIFWVVNILNNQLRPPLIPSKYLLSYRESMTLYLLLGMLMIVMRLFMQRIYNDFFRRRRGTTNVVIYIQDHSTLDPARLISIGYGQWRPISSNETSQTRWRNRRVELLITGQDLMSRLGDSLEQYASLRTGEASFRTDSAESSEASEATE